MTDSAPPPSAPRWCLPLLIVAGVVLAWCNRFVQDDAFISFVYARNLVEGEGLTWFGERIEGYSNPLWVLWISLGLWAGVSAITWSYVGGLLAFAATLWLTACVGARVLGTEGLGGDEGRLRSAGAILPVALLATNHTFSSYATGGLETMLQTLWITAALGIVVLARPLGPKHAALLSLALSLGVLTRPDGVVPAAVLGIAALTALRPVARARTVLCLLGPAALIGAAFASWKLLYYGELLPNTYYAKAGGVAPWRNGFNFLGRFMAWYGIGPLLAIGVVLALRRANRNAGWLTVVALTAAWCGYVISVGGDFMEFRFVVPILPSIALLSGLAMLRIGSRFGRPIASAAICGAVLVGLSIFHARRFQGTTEDLALDSIPFLATCYGLYPDEDWSTIGFALQRELGDFDSRVKLAMHPVGAIPYYSRLETIDMWGLNDARVARDGNLVDDDFLRPGHRRHASLAYLRERGVHLLLGHPIYAPPRTLERARSDPELRAALQRAVRDMVRFERTKFGSMRLVELPIVAGQKSLLAVNLTRQPALDRRIRDRNWPTLELEID